MSSERQKAAPKGTNQRTSMENELLEQLKSLLPIPEDTKMDKLSILRLAVAYIQARQDLSDVIETTSRLSLSEHDPVPEADLGPDHNVSDISMRQTDKLFFKVKDISLPETLISDIEEHLASRNPDKDSQNLQEKVDRYKEGLEKGINDFLQPHLTLESLELVEMNSVTSRHTAVNRFYSGKKRTSTAIAPKLPTEGEMMLKASDAFLMVLSTNLKVTFISDNITLYLGHCPYSVIGHDVENFIHPKDFKLLREFRDTKLHEDKFDKNEEEIRSFATFSMGMRYSFQTALARLKHTGFSTVQWNIRCRYRHKVRKEGLKLACFVAICCLTHSNDILDIKLGGTMFVTRHGLDYKYLFCEPNILYLLGYSSEDVVYHGLDFLRCSCNGRDPEAKTKEIASGETVCSYYRFMGHNMNWIWMQSITRLIYSAKGKPQFYECQNHITGLDDAEQYFCDKNMEILHKKKSTTPSKKKSNRKRTTASKDLIAVDNVKEKNYFFSQWHTTLLVPKVLTANDLASFSSDKLPICETIICQLRGLLSYKKDPTLSNKVSHSVSGFSRKPKEVQISKSRVEAGLNGRDPEPKGTVSDLSNHSDNFESMGILNFSSACPVNFSLEQQKEIQNLNNRIASGYPNLYQGTNRVKTAGTDGVGNGRNSLQDIKGELRPDQCEVPLKLSSQVKISEIPSIFYLNNFSGSSNTSSQASTSNLPDSETASCNKFSPLLQNASSDSSEFVHLEFDQVQESDMSSNQRSDILKDEGSDVCFNQELDILTDNGQGSDLPIHQSFDIFSDQGSIVPNNLSSDTYIDQASNIPNNQNSDVFINGESDMPINQSSSILVNPGINNQSDGIFINSHSDLLFNDKSDISNDKWSHLLLNQSSDFCGNRKSDMPSNPNTDIFIDQGFDLPINQSSDIAIQQDQGFDLPINQSSDIIIDQGSDISGIQSTVVVQSSEIPSDLSDLNMEEFRHFASTFESTFAVSHQDLNVFQVGQSNGT